MVIGVAATCHYLRNGYRSATFRRLAGAARDVRTLHSNSRVGVAPIGHRLVAGSFLAPFDGGDGGEKGEHGFVQEEPVIVAFPE